MPLINREININLTCSGNCVIFEVDVTTTIAITDIKVYVSLVTLSTQDNAKLLQKLRSGFIITINWNKYRSKVTIQR